MPVVRDLVPDMSGFYAQYSSIDPFLKRKSKNPNENTEFLQSKVAVSTAAVEPLHHIIVKLILIFASIFLT